MSIQEKRQVDNNELFAQMHKLQSDLTAKIDGLSGQLGDLRLLVVQSQSAYDAHDLPSKVDALSARTGALEIARATEASLPARVEDHDKRIKTIEKTENERDGRRKVFEYMVIACTLIGGVLTAIQLYQFLKGR